jgi:histidine triad (HIT) family protein
MAHAPPDYSCPFCALIRGEDLPSPRTTQAEIVLHEPDVVAFIASVQWPNNGGHVVVIPVRHFENLYDLPDDLARPLLSATRRVALALKSAYGCPGTSTRQHNEPAGNQEVWHYHVHVFPRYPDDALYTSQRISVPTAERVRQANRIREHLA